VDTSRRRLAVEREVALPHWPARSWGEPCTSGPQRRARRLLGDNVDRRRLYTDAAGRPEPVTGFGLDTGR
jgi:hypothetical protein